jgi:hypothetical protein
MLRLLCSKVGPLQTQLLQQRGEARAQEQRVAAAVGYSIRM